MTVSITEIIKRMFGISSVYAPFISMAVGIGLLYLGSDTYFIKDLILTGIIVGLSASGAYSTGDKIVKTYKRK
ncbi:MAG: hypothetical protein WC055_14700 [Melioribacteraceae bacterium]